MRHIINLTLLATFGFAIYHVVAPSEAEHLLSRMGKAVQSFTRAG